MYELWWNSCSTDMETDNLLIKQTVMPMVSLTLAVCVLAFQVMNKVSQELIIERGYLYY